MSCKQSSVFQRLFKTKLLWFSPRLFRTNEMAAESDVCKMPTVVMTGLPCSIAKKKAHCKRKKASLLTFSITSLIKVLVSLSKFTERQLVVIKTRNKPDKRIILCTSHSAVISSLGKDLGAQNWISIFAWSPGLQRWTVNHWSTYYFHRSIDMVHTTFKDFSSLFQRQITVSMTKI